VTTIATAGDANFELMARPNATDKPEISPSNPNDSSTSAGATPPNRKESPPTGASITTYDST
jgi:hypothetical protein